FIFAVKMVMLLLYTFTIGLSLSIQRHQYQAYLSECQVSLHSETSVSSLSVRVPGLSPFRDISIKPICQSARSLSIQRHQYQACLSRVPGLSPFRDISIKPICQSARSLSIQRHQYQAYLSECQVSLHSETSVSSLSVKSARSLSIQRHQYQAYLSRVPGLSPFRDISIKPACQECQVSLHSETSVSSLPVKSARSLSIQRHQYQACLSRVPGLSPFRDISIKPACQECQVSLHSETSVSSLPVKSARSLSIQRHQYQACLSRVPGLSPFRDISIKPALSSLSVRVPGLSPFRDIITNTQMMLMIAPLLVLSILQVWLRT
uniref:Uncharacterized protein n=1 Tax=Oncorhynchus mykiss TaxID=8022 RepID=A0A8K9WMU2_ONCMY